MCGLGCVWALPGFNADGFWVGLAVAEGKKQSRMREPELPFDDLPPSALPPRATALRVLATAVKPLSRNQRRFNRLVTRIEDLRAEIAATKVRLDAALAEYVALIHPLRLEEHRVRRDLVRSLAGFWRAPDGLGKRQRVNLRDLLLAQFEFFEAHPPEAGDEDLLRLAEELEQDAEREQNSRRKAAGAPPFGDPDGNDWDDPFGEGNPAMDEFLRSVQEQFTGATGQGATSSPGGEPPPPRKQTAAQKRREQREAELEAARKRGISTIYKQLAKVLHPDRERDPVRHAEKAELMKQLTQAYRSGDLHMLLRLELEFIHGEECRTAEMGDEKLAIYCDLLKEQVTELEEERERQDLDPRYAVLSGPFGFFAHRREDLTMQAKALRAQIESMAASHARLTGPEAKAELREALAAFASLRRRTQRSPLFDGYF